jgi:hypothetical protein
MATQAQIKANRQNARKSTGPKTDEGKAAVSQNAVKHGLFAESVINGENPAEYEAFHDEMLAELSPVGMIESTLAERIVSLFWRLKRAERMQNQVIEDMIERKVTNPSAIQSRERHCYGEGIGSDDPRFEPEHLALGRIAISDWANCRILDRMLMYERRIENSVIKLMKELKRFQVMRRIELEGAEKKQTTRSKAIPKAFGFEAATRSNPPSLRDEADTTMLAEKKCDLEKQTQFMPDEIGAKPFLKGDYDNMPVNGGEENKANRTRPEPVERSRFQDAGSDSAFESEEKCSQREPLNMQKT